MEIAQRSRWLMGVILALTLPGCLRLSIRRERVGEPIPAWRFAELDVGASTLTRALDDLGAPLRVFPMPGGGVGLAYGWSDSLRFDGSASIAVNEFAPAVSANVGNEQLDIDGWVLFFTPGDVLARVQRGRLGALIPGVRDRQIPIPN